MKSVPLTEWVEELESGARPKGGVKNGAGEIPSLGAEHLSDDGGFHFQKLKVIPAVFFHSMKKGKIKKNDILIVKDGATTGKVSFVNEGFPHEEAAINEHVFRISIDRRKADPSFVFRFLQSPIGQAAILSDFRGATVGGIGRTFVEKVRVPSISLKEQKRIAMILDQADSLRRCRQRAIDRIRTFGPAIFYEMFGDPITNPMEWNVEELGNLCDVVRGSSPRPQGDPDYFGGPVPRLMIADISRDGMRVMPRIDSLTEEGAKRSRPMSAGSVVMAVSGAVGLPAILEVDACIHDGFVGFRCLDNRVVPEFLYQLLLVQMERNRAQGTGAIWVNLTTDQVRRFPVPMPPKEQQTAYLEKVSSSHGALLSFTSHQRSLNTLFSALQHRAFRGKL